MGGSNGLKFGFSYDKSRIAKCKVQFSEGSASSRFGIFRFDPILKLKTRQCWVEPGSVRGLVGLKSGFDGRTLKNHPHFLLSYIA